MSTDKYSKSKLTKSESTTNFLFADRLARELEQLRQYSSRVEAIVCYISGLAPRSFTQVLDELEVDFRKVAVDGRAPISQCARVFLGKLLPKVSIALDKLICAFCDVASTEATRIAPGYVCAMRSVLDTFKQWLLGGGALEMFVLAQAPLPGIKVEASWTKCEQLKSLTGEGY